MGSRSNGHRIREDRKRQRRKGLPCYLCGQPIDYTLPSGEPLSFELEHKLPVITHPELEHEPTNHASSHRRCNREKSDGPINGSKQAPTSRSWL